MPSRTAAQRIAVAAVAAAALGLLGLAPAAAHTGSLFTVVGAGPSIDAQPADSHFATIAKTDAVVTSFAPAIADIDIYATEIFEENAYAIGESRIGIGIPTFLVFGWNHDTGEASAPLTVTVAGSEAGLVALYALDTRLDATLLSYARLEIEPETDSDDGVFEDWLVSIDPTTGIATQLIDLTDREGWNYLDSIATDPTTGITYGLVDNNAGTPLYVIFDIAGASVSGPFALSTVEETFGDGWMLGADFDAAGTLWFYYHQRGQITSGEGEEVTDGSLRGVEGDAQFVATDTSTLLASSTGAFGPGIGAVSSGYVVTDDQETQYGALATDPEIKVALASTGVPVEPIAATGLALLAVGGLTLAAFSRRRAA